MRLAQQHLFAVHLLTASGAALAVLALMAIAGGNWNTAFVWLGIALLIDGIDGPLARRLRIRERLPNWDGAAIDNVIDYTNYVFAPAIIAAQALGLPSPMGAIAGIAIAVTGALYYGATGMKQPDNSFRGFPVVWNMAVFILYVFSPPWVVTLLVIAGLSVLTFLPVNFVHPVRVVQWRQLTLAVVAIWFAASAWVLIAEFQEPLVVRLILLAATLYLAAVSGVQQFLRKV